MIDIAAMRADAKSVPKGFILASDPAAILALLDEIEALRDVAKALIPFADAAKTGVVDDALSFRPLATPDLTITRGFGSITISSQAFADAADALARLDAIQKGTE